MTAQHAYLLGGRPIHFPFISGSLAYSCSGCDAPCCRGTALGVGRSRELVTLRSVQPTAALFTTPGFQGSPMLSLQAPREACWFLDKKQRCRLERVVGRNAKPSGCRLFPFQRIRALGETVTVLPDLTCPMFVPEEFDERGPTSHDEICLEMHRTQVPRAGHPQLPPPKDLGWSGAVRLERAVIQHARGHLLDTSYLTFAQKQAALTASVLAVDTDRSGLVELDKKIRALIGAPSSSKPDSVRDMIVMTGIMRLVTSTVQRRELPSLFIALAAVVDVFDQMRGARPSLRTIAQIYESRLPLLFALAHLRDRPLLLDNVDPQRMIKSFPAVRAPLLNVLQAVVDNRTRGSARRLDEILADEGETFAAPMSFESVAMLYGLGRVLLQAGTFTPL